jgi:Rod binding domain-containing protein
MIGGLAKSLSQTLKPQTDGGEGALAKLGSHPKDGSAVTSGKNDKLAEAKKVAEDFETLFADMIMKSMRSSAKIEDSSNAMEVFEGMLDNEYSKSMTQGNDLGIKSLILDWMKSVDPQLKEKAMEEWNKERTSLQSKEHAAASYASQANQWKGSAK